MRTFLDDGKIDFKGDFFEYSGLFTAARPVQERMPLLMGGMKGPRSFIAAGELADGMHHALSYSREAYDYVVENVQEGRRQGGARLRRPRHRRVGGHRRGGGLGGGQAGGADPRRVLHLLDAGGAARAPRHRARARSQPVVDALGSGDVAGAIDAFSPELAERLSVAGTPEECVEKIKRDIAAGRASTT